MERASKSSIPEFLARRPFSMVHVDAHWDGSRNVVVERIRIIEPRLSAAYRSAAPIAT